MVSKDRKSRYIKTKQDLDEIIQLFMGVINFCENYCAISGQHLAPNNFPKIFFPNLRFIDHAAKLVTPNTSHKTFQGGR